MSERKPDEAYTLTIEKIDPPTDTVDTLPAVELEVNNYHGITSSIVGVYLVC